MVSQSNVLGQKSLREWHIALSSDTSRPIFQYYTHHKALYANDQNSAGTFQQLRSSQGSCKSTGAWMKGSDAKRLIDGQDQSLILLSISLNFQGSTFLNVKSYANDRTIPLTKTILKAVQRFFGNNLEKNQGYRPWLTPLRFAI